MAALAHPGMPGGHGCPRTRDDGRARGLEPREWLDEAQRAFREPPRGETLDTGQTERSVPRGTGRRRRSTGRRAGEQLIRPPSRSAPRRSPGRQVAGLQLCPAPATDRRRPDLSCLRASACHRDRQRSQRAVHRARRRCANGGRLLLRGRTPSSMDGIPIRERAPDGGRSPEGHPEGIAQRSTLRGVRPARQAARQAARYTARHAPRHAARYAACHAPRQWRWAGAGATSLQSPGRRDREGEELAHREDEGDDAHHDEPDSDIADAEVPADGKEEVDRREGDGDPYVVVGVDAVVRAGGIELVCLRIEYR